MGASKVFWIVQMVPNPTTLIKTLAVSISLKTQTSVDVKTLKIHTYTPKHSDLKYLETFRIDST